jgi:hypothetical protein
VAGPRANTGLRGCVRKVCRNKGRRSLAKSS